MNVPPLVLTILHALGAAISLLFGVACALFPKRMAAGVFFSLKGSRGVAEFRVGFGGMVIGLAGYVLWKWQPVGFGALGALWLGAAVSRVLTFFKDRPEPAAKYWGILGFELAMAGMLML
jgi:hypothetical protein